MLIFSGERGRLYRSNGTKTCLVGTVFRKNEKWIHPSTSTLKKNLVKLFNSKSHMQLERSSDHLILSGHLVESFTHVRKMLLGCHFDFKMILSKIGAQWQIFIKIPKTILKISLKEGMRVYNTRICAKELWFN